MNCKEIVEAGALFAELEDEEEKLEESSEMSMPEVKKSKSSQPRHKEKPAML